MVNILAESGLKQRLFQVEATGRMNHPWVVLWDERMDGVFPENMVASVGGLVRVGNALQVDAQKLAAFQAAQAAAATATSQLATRVAQAKTALNGAALANGDPDLTPLQIRQILRAFRIILKDLGKQLD